MRDDRDTNDGWAQSAWEHPYGRPSDFAASTGRRAVTARPAWRTWVAAAVLTIAGIAMIALPILFGGRPF